MESVCIYSRPSSSKNPKQKTEISVFFCLSFLDSVLYLVFLLVSEILVLLWITFYFTKWKSYEKKMTWWDFLSVADSQEARLYSLSTLFARFKNIHFVVNYFLPQKAEVSSFYFFSLVRNFVIFPFFKGKPNQRVLLLVTAPANFSWRNRPNRQA